MFETLVASTAPRQSRAGQLLTAVVVHAGIIVGAVTASESLSPHSSPAAPDASLVFVAPSPATAAPPVERHRFETPVLPAAPALAPPEHLEVAQPIPPALSTLRAPAADWSRTLIAGDPAPVGTGAPDSGHGPGGPLRPIETDQPPVPLRIVAPRYPPALARAGITGRVVAQFVVDTGGRVEPATIVILETSHPDFETPVREALARAAFRPGLFRGMPVPVLVRQPITFRREDGRAGR
ncbi:MAG: energy transducer TonB [Gemmatimonadales bacterium]